MYYIGGMDNNYVWIVLKNNWKGLSLMIDKNEKKEEAKKQRNLWQLNPVTRVIKNRKAYDRGRDRKSKRLYEYEEENESETDQKSQSLF